MFYCTLYLYGLVTVTNHTNHTDQARDGSYITICAYRSFYGLYIPTVTNGQVLRLMYRIHTHIHYIVLERLLTYCTRFLSPLSRYPYFCIVASYTAVYIPLIPWFAALCHSVTVASCFNMSYISLSFRHCKHTAFLIRLYISLTFIIN